MNLIQLDEEAIYHVARRIKDPEARGAYLRQVCDDTALRDRLEALLRVCDQEASFLESPAVGLPPTVSVAAAAPLPEGPGTTIGPYKLLEPIGEGGMGTVFMAEQSQPVRRKVALKVIKPGMDTKQVIARFEAERQALALMDHPNIARVLDAGATESGRPYFVMELVRGIPITDYCDREHLTIPERLELFVLVCRAVQHAHQKGIIHRDLKPSNVLVTVIDGAAVPKVIDFGVAKATGQSLTERTLFTGFHQFVGTPLYMSPEQADLAGADVDTRSDVYSLGVLLYELLTGTTPFDGEALRKVAFDEMRRIIREEEPPPPSTRLGTLDETLTTVSSNRKTDPRRLGKAVRGELDWIVMRTLDKDRSRRYESASALAADVRRFLDGLPVQASPPSATYRLKKAVRRHKGPAVSAALILLALVGGVIGATWGLVRAETARQAEARRAEGERRAKEAAQAREAETRAVLEFVERRVFAAARPAGQRGGLGREVSLRRAIEAALPSVATDFKSQPLIEARLRNTLGNVFIDLGDYQTAAAQHEAARALFAKHLGPDHRDTLTGLNNLASDYRALGRLTEALTLHEEALALRKATLGPDHPDTLQSMNNLAVAYNYLGRYTDALKLREETLAVQKTKLGSEHPDTLHSMNNLAVSYQKVGRYGDAARLHEETLALRKARLDPDHPDTLGSQLNLANSYAELGRPADALALREQTLPPMRAKLGPDHPFTLSMAHNLADSYAAFGRAEDSLRLNVETLARRKSKLGARHPDTLKSMSNLAANHAALGRAADALALREEALTLSRAALGADHPNTLTRMADVADSYAALGRTAEALTLHEQAMALQKAKLGPDHPDARRSARAVLLDRLRRFQAAGDAAGCRRIAEAVEKTSPSDPSGLYDAAAARAMTAAAARASDRSGDGGGRAGDDADRAVSWLKRAVAAGYRNAVRLASDRDFNALRDRADFQTLLSELKAGRAKK
jgi:serine/threonine protein kinase/tetratricopeptide (TPR) repeat protein